MAAQIKKGTSGGLDMTPMIDVVFQLMIFFLVATKLEEAERELEVVLPQASEAKPLTAKPQEIFINIDREGRYVAGNREYDEQELDAYLRQAIANNPATQSVVIRADENARHKFVARVVNLCQKNNVRDFRIATAEGGG